MVEVRGQSSAQPRLPFVTRLGVFVLFALAVANGVFLYFLPWLAETDYAWPIRPPINAAFIGAGYLAGVVATGVAVFVARYWRSIRGFILGFSLLGASLLIATLLHADRFRWGYPLTWLWTLVYMLIPPGAVLLWVMHERRERLQGDPTIPDAGLRLIRALSWPLGLAAALTGAVLFLSPGAMLPVWPWEITPLLARVFAGWYLLVGAMLLYAAKSARQPRELILPGLTVTAWNLLLLLLPLLYSQSVRPEAIGLWPWIGLHTALLLGSAVLATQGISWARAQRQAL